MRNKKFRWFCVCNDEATVVAKVEEGPHGPVGIFGNLASIDKRVLAQMVETMFECYCGECFAEWHSDQTVQAWMEVDA